MKNLHTFEEFLNESTLNESAYSGMSKDLKKLENGEELFLGPQPVKHIVGADDATVFKWFRQKGGDLLGKYTNKAGKTFACYKISANEISIKMVDRGEALDPIYKK